MKRGKEIKIDIAENYSIVFGTVDYKEPISVYINISAWGQPTSEVELDYGKIIRKLHSHVKRNLFSSLNKELFKNDNTIVDLDMRESGVAFGKRSFMSCEMTLFQVEEHSITSDILMEYITELITSLKAEVFESNEHFDFFKKKK